MVIHDHTTLPPPGNAWSESTKKVDGHNLPQAFGHNYLDRRFVPLLYRLRPLVNVAHVHNLLNVSGYLRPPL